MRHLAGKYLPRLLLIAGLLPRGGVALADGPGESLSAPGRPTVVGRLSRTPDQGFVFVEAAGNEPPIRLEPGMTLRFPSKPVARGLGAPPFRVDLGQGQQLSGRLGALTAEEVVLLEASAGSTVKIARAGACALVQRPGESLVLEEGFETLDPKRWSMEGDVRLAGEPRLADAHSLRMPGGSASLSFAVAPPFTTGRFETAFHDAGEPVSGNKWYVELTFRSRNGPEPVRVVLGWADPSLAVESPNGPALAVQRLARSTGWHRLSVRFAPDRFEVAVDGNELAHGKGAGGPLVGLKIATSKSGREEPSKDLSGYLDDLRLVQFHDPSSDVEIDATQDEVRLGTGDQLFGEVTEANPERLVLVLDQRSVRVSWTETTGIYFRRSARPGERVSGLLARAEWRVGPETEPRDLDRVEGALTEVTEDAILLATPYAGVLTIPRDRLTQLEILGKGSRLVLDPKAHHLGDEVSVIAPILDPPRPEGGVLECSFDLPKLREGSLELVLDVVQVAGEGTDLPFAMLVKKGELRTNVAINGVPFDYLNRHITTRNETPERIRLTIPRDQLQPGKNVIRLEQVGISNNPNYLDDLGILGMALEVIDGAPGR